MPYPSRAEYLSLADRFNIIPVWDELLVDTETAITIYDKLRGREPSFLLESVEGGEQLARYSFMGFKPLWVLAEETGKKVSLPGTGQQTKCKDLIQQLRAMMARYKTYSTPELPRFFGGAVGYFGYDLSSRFLRQPLVLGSTPFPQSWLMFPTLVLILDHVQHRLRMVALTEINDNPSKSYDASSFLLEQAKDKLKRQSVSTSLSLGASQGVSSYKANLLPEEFMRMVERAKEYIYAGDIFQVVLSRKLEVKLDSDAFSVYRTLRSLNPSPYMFFLDMGQQQLLGASPEMLVRVEDRIVDHRPIAGTRPRGRNAAEDLEYARDLLASEKERAEHLMLVDLGRNDVGRVCEIGSVNLKQFLALERFSHVMHLVSQVSGRLSPERDALDAFLACFPAGTVSGAPKIRAMEIIGELESSSRGPYAGAVGYLSLTGNLDTCIAIRSMAVHNDIGQIQTGAGIVADSDPQAEYEETLHKAGSLLAATQQANGRQVNDLNDR